MITHLNGNGNSYKRNTEITKDEIGYVHDLLATVLDDQDLMEALQLSEEEVIIVSSSMSVLCWILGHENQIFADGIKSLEEELKAMNISKLH